MVSLFGNVPGFKTDKFLTQILGFNTTEIMLMFGDKTNTDVDWLKNYATIPTNKGGFNPNCLTGQPPQLQKALKIMKLQKYETAKMVSNVSLFESLDMYFPNIGLPNHKFTALKEVIIPYARAVELNKDNPLDYQNRGRSFELIEDIWSSNYATTEGLPEWMFV
jgi:hypothetical protein